MSCAWARGSLRTQVWVSPSEVCGDSLRRILAAVGVAPLRDRRAGEAAGLLVHSPDVPDRGGDRAGVEGPGEVVGGERGDLGSPPVRSA